MNVILFGPPGIGKSTLVGTLKTLGQRAIDLEDMYPNKIRFQIPNLVNNTFIGAADLSPKRNYHNGLKVLLTMPDQEWYEERRAKRDKHNPEKRNQDVHYLEDWENEHYDLVLDVSPRPKKVASKLISFLKGWSENVRSTKD